MSLRAKFTLTIVAVLAVGFAGASLFSVENTRRLLSVELRVRGQAMLAALAPPCAVAMATGKPELLDAYVGQVSEPDRAHALELAYLMVIDTDGVIQSHSQPTRFGERPNDTFYQRAMSERGPLSRRYVTGDEIPVLEVTVPVQGGRRWGTLIAGFSLERLDRVVRWETYIILAASLTLALATWAALFFLLQRRIAGRVSRLAAAAQAFGRGEPDVRFHVEGRDEVALLAQSCAEMAERIRDHTEELERKVAERSRDLERANEEQRALVERLEQLAITDGLTGLHNHRFFQEALAREVQRCGRTEQPLSVVMIDVDHFKAYNDRNGHPDGDILLQRLSALLRTTLREVDVVARYGGEEFAVLLPDTPSRGAAVVAEKLRRVVAEEPFANEEAQPGGRVTISQGLATYGDHGTTPDALIRAADRALYRAKNAGRNRVEIASAGEE